MTVADCWAPTTGRNRKECNSAHTPGGARELEKPTHNVPVAYKQGQLVSTVFTPASHPEFRLSRSTPYIWPKLSRALLIDKAVRFQGRKMVHEDWEADIWQMPTG